MTDKSPDQSKDGRMLDAMRIYGDLLNLSREGSTFLKWDREANAKLYYALWIVFIGGFVLSINSSVRLNSPSECSILALHLFRILAVVGSALNFFLQNKAIDTVRYSHELLAENHLHRTYIENNEKDRAIEARGRGEVIREKLRRLDNLLSVVSICLLICASLFLICGLVLTWNIIPVAQKS